MTNTKRPALTLAHSDTTVVRTVTQEQAYRNLLDAIYAPTVHTPRRPVRRLSAV